MIGCKLQITSTQVVNPVCAVCLQKKPHKHIREIAFSLNHRVMVEWRVCIECLLLEHIDIRK